MLCMAEDGVVTPFLAQKDVKLRGLHNIENLLAAAAAVWGEVPVEAIRQVGSTFTGVEHRIEPVRTLDGVLYYNDSIGTSPTRTIAGLRSFDRKVILIAGGYDKHIPYEPLAPEIIAHVKNLMLMGATGPRIEQAVRECSGFDEAALPNSTRRQYAARRRAGACRRKSPAISSSCPRQVLLLTCNPNFEVRGREFQKDRQRAQVIAQVKDVKRRTRFANACRGLPVLDALLPLDCALFRKSQPWRFYAGPTLALELSGSTAWLAWARQTPQNWQAFCPSAGARAPFWTKPFARRRMAGGKQKR